MKPSTIVFDLDDTLIFEIDFVESAFNEIANIIDNSNVNLSLKMMEWFNRKENVFLNLQKIN